MGEVVLLHLHSLTSSIKNSPKGLHFGIRAKNAKNRTGHYEIRTVSAIFTGQFVAKSPKLARKTIICYTLYSSILEGSVVSETSLHDATLQFFSVSAWKYYQVQVQ